MATVCFFLATAPKWIKMFVLDEADEMLSRGFKDQIYEIFQKLSTNIQVSCYDLKKCFSQFKPFQEMQELCIVFSPCSQLHRIRPNWTVCRMNEWALCVDRLCFSRPPCHLTCWRWPRSSCGIQSASWWRRRNLPLRVLSSSTSMWRERWVCLLGLNLHWHSNKNQQDQCTELMTASCDIMPFKIKNLAENNFRGARRYQLLIV